MTRWLTLVAMTCALVACASRPMPKNVADSIDGRVGYEDLSATVASTARMELSKDEHFLVPLPEPTNAPPVYPVALLPQKLPPQALCLSVGVDEVGAVRSSRVVQLPPDCATSEGIDARFVDAARTALAAWQFDPAMRCVFAHGHRPEQVTCDGAKQVPEAVSLTYRFVFEQQDGRGAVKVNP